MEDPLLMDFSDDDPLADDLGGELSTDLMGDDAQLPALSGSTAQFTSAQKAALVIAALGPEAAAPIVQKIADKHLRSFVRAFGELSTVHRNDLHAVVEEFAGYLSGSDDVIKGGFDQARALLSEFKGVDETLRIMDEVGAPNGMSTWDKINEVNEKSFAKYMAAQHPQTIAVVFSKLNPDKASLLLAMMPEETARDVVVRMSKPINVSPQVVKVVADTIEREFLAPSKGAKSERNPGQLLGSMMNNLPSERRDALIEHLTEQTPQIIPEIQKFMLTFQDFATRVPANGVAIVVREVEEAVFMKALKFGRQNAPEVIDFIFENISQRMVQQYEEQLEAIEKVSVKDGEAAQRDIMTKVRELDASGELKLNEIVVEGGDDEDE